MNVQRTPLPDGNRDPLTVREIVVKALGARYPVMVARMISPDCPDVPAAVAALREQRPQWFSPADHGRVAMRRRLREEGAASGRAERA